MTLSRQAIHVRSIKLSTSDKEKWIDISNAYLITRMVHMIKKKKFKLTLLEELCVQKKMRGILLLINPVP